MTEDTPTSLRAQFNPLIRTYLLFYVGFMMCVTIVLIPLVPLWFLGVGQWWSRHYFHKLTCELDDQVLHFTKGILFTVEKTIPLENIQDVTFVEGPLLRRFDLAILKIETAGQSQGQAHAMELIGIIGAHAYRSAILEHRQAAKRRAMAPAGAPAADVGAAAQLAALHAIAQRLDEIAGLLRQR